MKIVIAVLIAAVVFVSGCAVPDIFGGNVINVQTRSVEEGVRDSIIVKDIQTIPNSPLLPDQEVLLSFIIENKEKIRPVRNIRIDMFNAPGFRDPVSKKLCNSGVNVCIPESGVSVQALLPGEERLIQFRLLAPSREQIANIKTQARFDFKVLYDFDGSMNFVIPAVNKDEIIRRQREGQKIDMVFDKSFSSGPVRVDVEPLGVNYLLDDLPTVLLFSIKNVGSGTIVKSQISCFGGACAGGTSGSSSAGISIPDDNNCNSNSGTCKQVSEGCSGGRFFPLLCAGGSDSDRQCCLPSSVTTINIPDDRACNFNSGACMVSGCAGISYRFLCSGGNDNQCCIQSSVATRAGVAGTAPSQGLEVTFARGLDVVQTSGDVLSEIFDRTQAQDGLLFRNTKKEIQIFRDKSQTSLRFPVKFEKGAYNDFKSSQIPFRSYEIKSNVYYTYELRNYADVVVNLFENA